MEGTILGLTQSQEWFLLPPTGMVHVPEHHTQYSEEFGLINGKKLAPNLLFSTEPFLSPGGILQCLQIFHNHRNATSIY
jgi:hypothetical protein